jgi:hypothetical protein
MANTAFDHASALTIPGSTTNNGLVRWGDTSGTSFGNITGITSDGSNITLLTRGEIRFSDADSTHFIALESPATVSTSYTMTLPAAVPSAADYLKVTSYSGGAGVLEWASVSADTNTTYLTSWVDSSANAILRLTPSSGSADDLTIVAGTNITLTPSGDNLTIDAAGGSDISVRVYHDATQSASNDAWFTILFNSERFDTDTMHDTGSNTSRLTATTAGVYVIFGNMAFDGNSTGRRLLRILLNGTGQGIAYVSESVDDSDAVYMNISTIYKMDADDYVELLAFQDSGGSLNVRQSASFSPEFAMVKI